MSYAGPGAWYLKEGLLEGKISFSLKISSENNHTMKLKNINGSECILYKYPLSSKQPKR